MCPFHSDEKGHDDISWEVWREARTGCGKLVVRALLTRKQELDESTMTLPHWSRTVCGKITPCLFIVYTGSFASVCQRSFCDAEVKAWCLLQYPWDCHRQARLESLAWQRSNQLWSWKKNKFDQLIWEAFQEGLDLWRFFGNVNSKASWESFLSAVLISSSQPSLSLCLFLVRWWNLGFLLTGSAAISISKAFNIPFGSKYQQAFPNNLILVFQQDKVTIIT